MGKKGYSPSFWKLLSYNTNYKCIIKTSIRYTQNPISENKDQKILESIFTQLKDSYEKKKQITLLVYLLQKTENKILKIITLKITEQFTIWLERKDLIWVELTPYNSQNIYRPNLNDYKIKT